MYCLKLLILIIIILCIIVCTKDKNYSYSRFTPNKDSLGWNVSFRSDVYAMQCPMVSVNDAKIGMTFGGSNFRNFYPDELVDILNFDKNPVSLTMITNQGQRDASGNDTGTTNHLNPSYDYTTAGHPVVYASSRYISATGALKAFKYIQANGGHLTVTIWIGYDMNKPFYGQSDLTFANVLSTYKNMINRLQIGLISDHYANDPNTYTNPTETPLSLAIYDAKKRGGTFNNNIILSYLDYVKNTLNSIGRNDIEIIIPAQGDVLVDSFNQKQGTTHHFGNIYGPKTKADVSSIASALKYPAGYTSDFNMSTYDPWVGAILTKIANNFNGHKIHFAQTVYPFYSDLTI